MHSSLPSLCLTLFLSTPLLAQKPEDPALSYGDKAPPLAATWLRGSKTMKKSPPKTYLLLLLAPGEEGKALLRTLPPLEKRFKAESLRALAILCPEKGKAGPARAFFRKAAKGLRFPIGLDKAGDLRKNWAGALGVEELPLAILVRDGRIQWFGKPDEELVYQVEDALDGSLDLGQLWLIHNKAQRIALGKMILRKDIKGVAAFVDKLLKKFPTSKFFLAQKHYTLSKLEGREKADAFFRKLLPKLKRKNPFAAIKLAQEYLGIRASDEMKAFMLGILEAIGKTKGKPAHEALLALLSHWDRKQESPKAISVAEAGFKRFKTNDYFLKRLCAKLFNSKHAQAYRSLLKKFMDYRAKKDPNDIEAFRTGFEIAAFFFDDKAEQMKRAKAYAAKLDKQENLEHLNGFVWMLLTEDRFGPDYYPLALMGAKRILEFKEIPAFILDSAALAFFKNGDKKKAIELEEKALALAKKEGNEKAIKGYTQTLEKFRK
ncbi:MAG TPA: hypothetical protein ENK02_01110 [Planctomycetes bacterium]|nr:hypothetical protein [Planctomycetota bacterium]